MRSALVLCLLGCATPVEAAPPQTWHVVEGALDRVALTVHVTGDDVWIGGGGLGTGPGSLLLHGDGARFAEVALGRSETIWWIAGSAPDDLWAVGERGLALHGDGARFVATETGTTLTLYGVWARARDDAWAVGGDPNGATSAQALLHWDGVAWRPSPSPAPDATLFKVWGRAGDDVYAVGAGIALHYDGASWREVTLPSRTTLFTVAGGGAGIFAVGGGPPTLLRLGGSSFGPVELPDTANGVLSGVAVSTDTVFVVGERKQRYRLIRGTFHDDSPTLELPLVDLHAVAALHDGAIAVGGNYMALMRPGTRARGAIVRFGR